MGWVGFLIKYLVFQTIMGIILFEWCWKATAVYRSKNEKRDAKFPEFRRLDNIHNWTRSMFYPGVLFMFTRSLAYFGTIIVDAIVVYLLSIGHDYKKGPM